MPVENEVNIPARVSSVNPIKQTEKTDPDIDYYEKLVKKERAKRQFLEEKKLAEQVENPPEPEPPFRITGGVNLGTIDLQAEQQKAKEESERLREQSEERMRAIEKERDTIRDELTKTRIEHIQQHMTTQIEQLKNMVAAGGAKRDIVSEIEAIEAVANKLGLSKSGAINTDLDTLKANLEIKRLEADMARENRRFLLDQKKEERLWQLEIKKLEQQEKESNARLLAEQHRYDMLAALPEQIGGAIAKGLLASGSDTGGQAQVLGGIQSQALGSVQLVEAETGETGEIDCPTCHTKVGIADTTVTTECVRCGQKFQVKRIPKPESEPV